MNPQMSGAIINMASVMGTFGRPGSVRLFDRQGGDPRLHAVAGARVAVRNIRVNSIAPGWIDTDMTAPLGRAARSASPRRRRCSRLGEPDDIAWAAVYLASEEAKFMTGQVISPNGGWYMSQ